jgi:hypothetical protein
MGAILIAASALGFVVGCGSGGSSSAGSAGTGGSSGTMGAGAGAPTCDQTCVDDGTGYAIDNTAWLINNEDLAGKAAGVQDVMVACPGGGTVHITGDNGVSSNNIETLMLTLDMQACENSGTTFSLSFTGQLEMHGTFGVNGDTSSNAVSFASDSLVIDGTIREENGPSVNETCSVAITDTYDHVQGETGWLNGTLCARTVAQ